MRRRVLYVGAAATLSSATYLLAEENRRRKTISLCMASQRILHLIRTATLMSMDYGYHMYWKKTPGFEEEQRDRELLDTAQTEIERLTIHLMSLHSHDEEYSRVHTEVQAKQNEIEQLSHRIAQLKSIRGSYFSDLHHRCALRLRDMCIQNKGIYIKLGQHLSMLDYILPEEYTMVLKALLNKNPHSSYESICKVIKEDVGSYPEELFTEFHHDPIASASLAQVHVAYDHNGNKLAVKVQHDGLRESSEGDMIAITFVVSLISSIFKGFSYTFLTREMNQNLPQELDFETGAVYTVVSV